MDLVHAINTSLKAHHLFKLDVDYMVQDGKIVIVDEFTGRLMPGRRYSDGLHQALEAKERVKVEEEYQTLASVTFQKLLPHVQEAGRHDRHGGHGGDRVPPHLRPRRRRDPHEQDPHPLREPRRHLPDRRREVERRRRGDHRPQQERPSRLVGTISIEKSSTSARSSAARTSSTSSSTPSTTSRRPRSSPKRAASGL